MALTGSHIYTCQLNYSTIKHLLQLLFLGVSLIDLISIMSCCKAVSFIFDPKKPIYRYIILFLLCYIQFASSYCVESPAGLKEIIIDVLEIDNAQYSLIFSVTGWISIVICITGGFIIDRCIGIRLGCILSLVINLIGQVMYTAGIFLDNFFIMLIGRTVLGISSKLNQNVSLVYRALWFKSDLSFAVSLGTSFTSLGGFLALSAPAFLHAQTDKLLDDPLYRLGSVTFVEVFLLCIALVFSLILMALDWRGEKILGKRESFPTNTKLLSCADLKNFTPIFWMIAAAYGLFFTSYFLFGVYGQSFYISRYNLNLYQASLANSMIYCANAFMCPLFGIIIGITGYNGYWGMLGLLIFGGANILLAMSNQYTFMPYLGGFLISVAYAAFNVSIIAVPIHIIEKNQLSLSYGIMMSLYSLTFSILSIVAGVLIDHYGYLVLQVLYTFISYVNLILLLTASIMEYGEDQRRVNSRRKH